MESAGVRMKRNQLGWGWNGISCRMRMKRNLLGVRWNGIRWSEDETESAGVMMKWNQLQDEDEKESAGGEVKWNQLGWGWDGIGCRLGWSEDAKSFLFPGSGTSSVFLSTSPFCFSSLLVSFFSSFSSVTVFSSLPSSLSATSAGTVTQNKEKLFIIFHSVNTLLYLGREAIYFCVRT